MKSKQTIILEELHSNNWTQKDIADDLGVSESYISQIVAKSRMLKIPLRFIDNKLVCAKCEKEYENLMFHHNHSTGEYIALVCRSCNVKFRANNDFEFWDGNHRLDNNKVDYIGCRVDKEMLENIKKLMNIMDFESTSNFLRKMIRTMIKNGKEKGLI